MSKTNVMVEDAINKQTYLSPKVIDYYSRQTTLQPPEKTIFDLLHARLPAAKMLDIGVGAGRTTEYFAPLVKSYTAVDFSEGMIERCKVKYASQFPEAQFAVADAKDLHQFENDRFDFILFSFNGIDYMPVDARIQFLRKAKRLLENGGHLCFSTHNIFSLRRLTVRSAFHFRWNLPAALARVWRRIRIRRMNAAALRSIETSDFVFVNDGTHDFGLKQCFIRPSYQLKLLRECGFASIRAFELKSGKEYVNEGDLTASEDGWIYFLCS